MGTWTEEHPYARARAKLTSRAVAWALEALRHDDTTVSAIARHLGVDWHTAREAIRHAATTHLAEPGRLTGVKTLGVDEHIWRPSKNASADKAVTVMVNLPSDAQGQLHARLLDAVQGRSGRVYADWLTEAGVDFTVSIEPAALDPFRGYANAIRDELPDAVAVLDAFHVVKLAGNALDEVRRRVQQKTLGRRGRKEDPLYRIRRTLLTGREHLTERQRARLDKHLPVGDPTGEVQLTWTLYQEVRAIYHAATPRKVASSPPSSSTPCTRARYLRSHASDGACASGARRSSATSLPAGSQTAARRRSTAASRRRAASPMGSGTSPTTGSGSS